MRGNWLAAAVGAGLLAVFLALRFLEKTVAPPPLPPPATAPTLPPEPAETPPSLAPSLAPAPSSQPTAAAPPAAPVTSISQPPAVAAPQTCESRVTIEDLVRGAGPALQPGQPRLDSKPVFEAALCDAVARDDVGRCSGLERIKGPEGAAECRSVVLQWRFNAAALRGQPSAERLCDEANIFTRIPSQAEKSACRGWTDFLSGRQGVEETCRAMESVNEMDGDAGPPVSCKDFLAAFSGDPARCASLREAEERSSCVDVTGLRRALRKGPEACGDSAACRAAVQRDPRACGTLFAKLAKEHCQKREGFSERVAKEEDYRRRNKLPSFKPGDEFIHSLPAAQREAAIERAKEHERKSRGDAGESGGTETP